MEAALPTPGPLSSLNTELALDFFSALPTSAMEAVLKLIEMGGGLRDRM